MTDKQHNQVSETTGKDFDPTKPDRDAVDRIHPDSSTHVGAKPTAEEQAALNSTQDVYGSKDKDSLEKSEDK